MFKKVLAFILVFSVCMSFTLVFAAETDPQLFCPNCNTFQPQGVVTAHSYCPKCGCSLMSFGGGSSRGGGAGRTDVPKKYYTQGTGSGGQYKVSTGTTNYYSVVNTTNKTLNYTTYNTTTNNYTYNSYTYNSYTYNNEYNYYTYNINNQYYYVTNNYTYVTISYPNGTKNDEGNDNYDNVDIYYQLPDGRNSSYLTVDQVWGEYFIYNGTNYQSIMEDDGKTLGLWHLDGSIIDESIHPSTYSSVTPSTYSYDQARFDIGLVQKCSTAATRNVSIKVDSPDNQNTVSFWVYYSSTCWRWSNSQNDAAMLSTVYPSWTDYKAAFPTDVWCYVVLTTFSDTANAYIFVDGKPYSSFYVPFWDDLFVVGNRVRGSSSASDTTDYYSSVLGFDELRITRGPSWPEGQIQQQPWDSNLVFVAPSDPQENDVAIKSSVPVSTFRVGGARPTYPSNGATYVAIESGIVKSVQQWSNNQWNSVGASIYTGGEWVDFLDYDLVNFGNDDDSEPPDTGGSGGSGGSGEGSGIWDTVADAILNFFSVLGDIVGAILSGVINLFTTALGNIVQGFELASNFSSVLSSFYSFLPAEWQLVLTSAFSVLIIVGVVKIFLN